MLEVRKVLDHAQEDLLAQVIQVARGHTLANQPAANQRTVKVRQVFPGIRFAGLRAKQQALPRFVHGFILTSPGRGVREDF